MKISELKKYSTIAIVGYAREGIVTEKFIKKYHPKAKIIIADQKLNKNYLDLMKKADLAIKTPVIPSNLITIPYTTATNLFFANCHNMIIGITGTKGKSTTTALLHHVCQKAGKYSRMYGNIGIPMLSALLTKPFKKDIFILELSSYQLDDIAYSPHISVILNIYNDHIEFHKTKKNYINAKLKIVNYAKQSDYIVYDHTMRVIDKNITNRYVKRINIIQKLPFSSFYPNLIGEHNMFIFRTVYTVSKLLNIKKQVIKEAIESFKGLPHRLENVGIFNSIVFINDSAANNPESTIYAIKTIKNISTLIVGGKNRNYNLEKLSKIIINTHIPNIVLFKDTGVYIKQYLSKFKNINILETDSMEDAVKFAYSNSKPNTTCLLSPGAPSYLTYTNFEDRGDQFKLFIQKYA